MFLNLCPMTFCHVDDGEQTSGKICNTLLKLLCVAYSFGKKKLYWWCEVSSSKGDVCVGVGMSTVQRRGQVV